MMMMMKIRQQQRNMMTAQQDTNEQKQADAAASILDFRGKMPAPRYDILPGSYTRFPSLSPRKFWDDTSNWATALPSISVI